MTAELANLLLGGVNAALLAGIFYRLGGLTARVDNHAGRIDRLETKGA